MPQVRKGKPAAQPRPAPGRPPARRGSIFRDPVVRVLAWGAVGLIVLYLITIVSALAMGVLGSTAPRTVAERNERVYESIVAEDPTDVVAWRKYIRTLLDTGQTLAAQDAIDRALQAVDETGNEEISTAQAELYFSTSRYEEGIALADQIRGRLEVYYEEAKGQPDSPESRGAEIHENYWALVLMKAEAYDKLGDTASALEEFDLYLEERPTAADILVRRGYIRIDTGDTAGAEADFRAALRYLPGDKAALDGLKQIGVEE
jgi:tetratricopeptide (TPR) repeat protein